MSYMYLRPWQRPKAAGRDFQVNEIVIEAIEAIEAIEVIASPIYMYVLA